MAHRLCTPEQARQATKAMTVMPYDYAEDILTNFFQTLTTQEAVTVLQHVGRYAEKTDQWPDTSFLE